MEEGVVYNITDEDFKNPNFPKLNEWFASKKFEYQLTCKYEIRSAILVGGTDVRISRTQVYVMFYDNKFEEQVKRVPLGIGDAVRIFPCEEKVNILQIESPSPDAYWSLGPGEEPIVQTLTFDKNL